MIKLNKKDDNLRHLSNKYNKKQKIIKVFNIIETFKPKTSNIYKILSLIEFIFFFVLVYNLNFINISVQNSNYFMRMIEILKFLNLYYISLNNYDNIIHTFIYWIFSLNIIIILIFFLNIIFFDIERNKKISSYKIILAQLVAIYINFSESILIFFNLQSFYFNLLNFINNNNKINTVSLIFSILNLVIQIIFSLINMIVLVDYNPFNNNKLSTNNKSIYYELYVFFIKLLIPLFLFLDTKNWHIYQIIISILYFFKVIFNILFFRYYNYNINKYFIYIDSILLFFTIYTLILTYSNESLNLKYFFILILIYPFIKIFDFLNNIIINSNLNISLKRLKSKNDMENFLILMIILIKNINNYKFHIYLIKIIDEHYKYCNDLECVCKTYKEHSYQQNKNEVYYFKILLKIIDDKPKSHYVKSLICFIQNYQIKNKFHCFYNILELKKQKINFKIFNNLFSLKENIEEKLIEEDKKFSFKNGWNVLNIVNIKKYFNEFKINLTKVIESNINFWQELSEKSPDVNKIRILGNEINKKNEKLNDLFSKIVEINKNFHEVYILYGNFLKLILNKDNEGKKHIDNGIFYKNLNKENIEQNGNNNEINFTNKTKFSVLIATGNINRMGYINYLDENIVNLLGYKKTDLINQNIKIIIPEFISTVHDQIMMNFIYKGKYNLINSPRIAFPVHKEGYLIPCKILLRILPIITNEISFILFMSKHDEFNKNKIKLNPYFIIYNNQKKILGFTKNFRNDFKIPFSILKNDNISKNKINIDDLFSNLEEIEKNSINNKETDIFLNNFNNKYLFNEFCKEKNKTITYSKTNIINENILYNGIIIINEKIYNRKIDYKVLKFYNPNYNKTENSINSLNNSIINNIKNSNLSENEKERKIIDLKTSILQKKLPKTIKLFLYLIIIFFILFLTNIILTIILNSKNHNGFIIQNNLIYNGNLIINNLFKIMFFSELIYMNKKTKLGLNYINSFLKNITDIDEKLLNFNNNYNWVRLQTLLEYNIDYNKNLTNIKNLFINNEIINFDVTLNEGIKNFINNAFWFTKSNISNFENNNSESYRYYYFLINNGRSKILLNMEETFENFNNFYFNKLNTDYLEVNIYFSVYLILIFLILIFTIPIIIKIENNQNKIIVLFAVINQEECLLVKRNSKNFLKIFLKIKLENVMKSYTKDSEINSSIKSSKKFIKESEIFLNDKKSNNDYFKKFEENENYLNLKTKKILNYKKNINYMNIFKYFSIYLFLILIISVYYGIEINKLNNIKLILNFLNIFLKINNSLFGNTFYTIDNIIYNSNIKHKNLNIIDYYRNQIYNYTSYVQNNYNNLEKKNFNEFFNKFKLYNNNLCEFYKNNCDNSEFLSKGFNIINTRIAEITREIINNRSNFINLSSLLRNSQFILLIDLIQKNNIPLEQISNLLNTSFQNFISNFYNDLIIIIIFKILILISILLIIIKFYIFSLNNLIWKSKKILNMIPNELIFKNKKLLKIFQFEDDNKIIKNLLI